MRVVLVSREYPPAARGGGIGTNTEIIAGALSGRGHEVHVLTRGQGKVRRAGGVTVHELRHRWAPRPSVERFIALRGIGAAARRLQPDVIHAAEWEAEAWWPARFGRVPVVTRLATPTFILEELNGGAPDPGTALVRRLEREQTQRSAAVYGPTRAIADRLAADWSLAGVEVIPNPVDLAAVHRDARAAPPARLPERYVCFFGRLERRKGIEPLAAALAAVMRARPDVHAVLIGRDAGGVAMERVESTLAAVRDRVVLTGELPRRDALAIVAGAEVVALPSLWESFGYVCVEAMTLGRAVVASRAGGLAEIVEDGVNGRLVRPGDDAELGAVIGELLDDPGERARLGRAGEARAEDFSVDGIVGHVEALLERAAARELSSSVYRRGYRRHFRPDEPGPFRRLYAAKREAVLRHFAAAPPPRIADVGGG
jgi:glycogen(starch) synthase